MPTTTTKQSSASGKSSTRFAATKDRPSGADGAGRLIDPIQDAEHSSLEAVRPFVDAVDQALSDVIDDGPRHKVIDAAFEMVEELVRASNDLARGVVKVSQESVPRRGDG